MIRKNSKSAKRSLLSKFFATKTANNKSTGRKYVSKSLTPRQRSIAEIKQMAEIGKKDPERLAKVLSGMLRKNREVLKDGKARLKSHVADIVRRDEKNQGRST